jgi:hypothetical protein
VRRSYGGSLETFSGQLGEGVTERVDLEGGVFPWLDGRSYRGSLGSATDLSAVKDHSPIGKFDGAPRIVGDNDEGSTALSLFSQTQGQSLRGSFVEASEGLIEKQHPWTVNDRASDREALGHPAREGPGPAIGHIEQREGF